MKVSDLTDFAPQRSGEPTGSVCRQLTGRGIASSQRGRAGRRRQKPMVSVFLFPLSSPSPRALEQPPAQREERRLPKGSQNTGVYCLELAAHRALQAGESTQRAPRARADTGSGGQIVSTAKGRAHGGTSGRPGDGSLHAPILCTHQDGDATASSSPAGGSCPRQMPTSRTSC